MRPAARVQAAAELLDAIIAAVLNQGASADRLIADYFRQRRYAGAKDRRAVREMVYAAMRACGPVPGSGRAALLRLAQLDPALRELFDGSPHGPARVMQTDAIAEPGIAPDWLVARLAASGIGGDAAAVLLDRAPLDIRVNALKTSREAIALPLSGERLLAPHGLRLPTGTPVQGWGAYQAGLFEVQDHGSQWACAAVGAMPNDRVIDLCSGAGGKTLALAAAMQNQGTVLATDTDRTRLARIAPRAQRAGVETIRTRLLNPGQELAMLDDWRDAADIVLVDAPCSGTGTWRRNPELRWRLSPLSLRQLIALQARLIDVAHALLRPGGRLVFVTCSLLDEEGADQVAAAMTRLPLQAVSLDLPVGHERGAGTRLSPAADGTDGFFIAQLYKAC